MHAIVPLAGPDFVSRDGSIKAMYPLDGLPLLQRALQSRPWSTSIKHYSFILYDSESTRSFVSTYLSQWYSSSSFVYLSSYTRGAALSALAGLTVLPHFHAPLIVDLADILFTSDLDIDKVFFAESTIGGIVPSFTSTLPHYSYLKTQGSQVTQAAEKKIISSSASSGTYIFRNSSIFLRALAHAFENEPTQTFDNQFYVCPLVNGILDQGLDVRLEPVSNVVDIKRDI